MDKAFEKLKKNQKIDAARIKKFAGDQPFSLATKRTAKLARAGVRLSGTLLHKNVATAHGEQLFEQYRKRINGHFNQERLRYLTVIHSLDVLDEDAVLKSCETMVSQLRGVLSSECWWLGVIETELVSLKLMRSFQAQEESARHKLDLINELDRDSLFERASATSARCLMHCHVIVDLGNDDDRAKAKELSLRAGLAKFWSGKRQVVLSRLSTMWRGKRRTLRENLHHIALYGTKGGNEELRFKLGFGRDHLEDIESLMFKKYGKKLITEDDDGAVEDARSLSANEIKFLDGVMERLMNRRGGRQKRGYIIGTRYS